MAGPAVSGRSRSQSAAGQDFQGTRPEARSEASATRAKSCGWSAETGIAAYWSVPARAKMAAPAQSRQSSAPWSRSRVVIGFASPPAWRRTATAMSVAPQPKAARRRPLAWSVKSDAAVASRAIGGDGLRENVSSSAAGSSTKRPKAKDTASRRIASRTPAPSSPTVRSSGVRWGAQIAIVASSAAQAKRAAIARPEPGAGTWIAHASAAPAANRATGSSRSRAGI